MSMRVRFGDRGQRKEGPLSLEERAFFALMFLCFPQRDVLV